MWLPINYHENGNVFFGLRRSVLLQRFRLYLCVHYRLVRNPVDNHVKALEIRLLRRGAYDGIRSVLYCAQPRTGFFCLRGHGVGHHGVLGLVLDLFWDEGLGVDGVPLAHEDLFLALQHQHLVVLCST